MDIPVAFLDVFPPSADLLLDVLRRRVDDWMLREIAEADYGCDAERHLAALRPIRDRGIIPAPMGWIPGEVLALTRWSDPDGPAKKPLAAGRRGHQIRAFACAVLLRAQVEAGEADEATLAQCLASARVLGDEASDAAARFLTWGIPRMTYNRWLFAAGLLVVATRFRPGSITDRILGEAAGWVLAEESEERKKFLPFNPADPPPSPFGLAYGHWKPLAAELLDNAAVIPTPEVRNDLELIGAILLEPC